MKSDKQGETHTCLHTEMECTFIMSNFITVYEYCNSTTAPSNVAMCETSDIKVDGMPLPSREEDRVPHTSR